jgi:hypothetical protein
MTNLHKAYQIEIPIRGQSQQGMTGRALESACSQQNDHNLDREGPNEELETELCYAIRIPHAKPLVPMGTSSLELPYS